VARTWGGKRAGAGRSGPERKAAKDRTVVAHCARPEHAKRHPTNVPLRARKRLPSFRSQRVHAMLRGILERQMERRYGGDFQVVRYSIQSNHLHVVVESAGKRARRSGVARDLTTPSEVRNALVYLLK
jgi:hypothetical protein